jgi:hypothetical protein
VWRVAERPHRAGGPKPAPGARPPATREQPPDHRLTALQRAAGNRAVTRLTGTASPADLTRLPVQRHSSWEHTLLGDTPPRTLGAAAVSNASRKHVLADLWDRMRFFQADPRLNPTARFPDVRWVQLRASGLWVSNGELNGLGDYLPDPAAYDTLPAEQLIPVLQRMRSGILGVAAAEFGLHSHDMAGMAEHWMPGAAGEVKALDAATAGLGTNRYAGLLSRNACHFAPFSWDRWALYHNEAAEEAVAHFHAGAARTPLNTVDTSVEEHQRQAVLKNGYADHFLQDSFAAGHLVNKTQVMQWFVDYLNGMNWLDRPWVGMPSGDVMARMGSAQQLGIAGQNRYGHGPASATSREDRGFGTVAIDPQTAQERSSRDGRVAGSGVSGTGAERERNYQAYLKFLNSAFLQMSAGAVHDYFNLHGLTVINGEGTRMQVGGDDTLLSKSSEVGAEVAGRAAEESRTAIDDLLRTGSTTHTTDAIFRLVPQQVAVAVAGGGEQVLSLAQFQADVVRPLCFSTLFPELVDGLKGTAIRMFGSEMVDGGTSVDSGVPAPVSLGPGDFPASGGDRYG